MSDERFGPEHLSQYADRLSRDGDDLEAARFRLLERAWQDTERQLQAAQDDNTQLQRKLDAIRREAA